MVSVRTKYRQKRIELITDSIKDLANLLLLNKKSLERIHIKYFKSVKKAIEEMVKQGSEPSGFTTAE